MAMGKQVCCEYGVVGHALICIHAFVYVHLYSCIDVGAFVYMLVAC